MSNSHLWFSMLPYSAFYRFLQKSGIVSKNEKIVGFHAYQSFAKGEVQPELAHKIGVRLAEEMWGDRFQVVVTTHLNTNHFYLLLY